jgi:tight adherence protein B
MGIRSRRQTAILNQLPGMIGELARAARTGRSLEQCLELVANDTPAPLGTELKLCSGRLAMGLSPEAAFRDLPERTGVQTLNVLVTALVVHHRTGGDLVRVLDRLAHTIRDRISFLGRLRAQTAASRATAVLMITIPIFILAFFIFRDPTYLTRLMASSVGRLATVLAVVLQIVGSIVVLRILKNTARS